MEVEGEDEAQEEKADAEDDLSALKGELGGGMNDMQSN